MLCSASMVVHNRPDHSGAEPS